MLKTKLHRATVTGADLHYEGSIGIDRDLLDASGILPHEQVDVLNINTGARFTTYAIEAPRGSAAIAVNGAASRLVQKGDKVIIVAYCQIPAEEARNYHPSVVLLGEDGGSSPSRRAQLRQAVRSRTGTFRRAVRMGLWPCSLAAFSEPRSGVRLLREFRLEVVRQKLGLGPVDHADRTLELGLGQGVANAAFLTGAGFQEKRIDAGLA